MNKPKRSSKRWLEGAPECVVACYDNGGKTFDRYTVLFREWENEGARMLAAIGMSANPFHPQGFCEHTSAARGPHLGRKIRFNDLPASCRRVVQIEAGNP